jgi:hypothetical protein
MFENDFSSYVLCRYSTKNLMDTRTGFYVSIQDAFEYIVSICKQNKKDFIKKYKSYQSGCLFNFEYEQNIYELYRVEKNCKCVLLTFDLETNMINSVSCFESEETALDALKEGFKKISKSKTYKLEYGFDKDIVFNNNKIYGMTHKCIKRLCDMTKEEIKEEIQDKFRDIDLENITIEPKNKNQLLYEDGAYFRIITGCYKFKYYDDVYEINIEAQQYYRVGFNDIGKESTEIEIDCDESFLKATKLTDKDIINYVGDVIEEHVNDI